jgi:hypothetical protein
MMMNVIYDKHYDLICTLPLRRTDTYIYMYIYIYICMTHDFT